jgi:hypothetical protein
VVVDIVLPAVLGLVLVGEAGIEAYTAPELVSISRRISEAQRLYFRGDLGSRSGVPAVSCSVSHSSSSIAESREKGLTSNELEGLGDHLALARVVVLVVRHVCDILSVVFGGGVAAMGCLGAVVTKSK